MQPQVSPRTSTVPAGALFHRSDNGSTKPAESLQDLSLSTHALHSSVSSSVDWDNDPGCATSSKTITSPRRYELSSLPSRNVSEELLLKSPRLLSPLGRCTHSPSPPLLSPRQDHLSPGSNVCFSGAGGVEGRQSLTPRSGSKQGRRRDLCNPVLQEGVDSEFTHVGAQGEQS